MRTAKVDVKESSKIKVIPLGGLEAIGMNITVFEYEDEIIVVDCGLSFPDDDNFILILKYSNIHTNSFQTT